MLQSLSYKNVLKRGYAVVRDAADKPLTRAAAIAAGQSLSIEFADGRVEVAAGEAPDGGFALPAVQDVVRKKAAPKASPNTQSPGDPPKQGSLF